ncbi:MAG: amidase domain-containing protein [Clostridia bacterium]|nr:amidase domain-containing protein [Clostridia bacterium]
MFIEKGSDNLSCSVAGRGVKPGDVIGLQNEKHKGTIYHMVIVTSVDSKGNVCYAAHSNFRQNYPLSEAITQNNIYVLRLNY